MNRMQPYSQAENVWVYIIKCHIIWWFCNKYFICVMLRIWSKCYLVLWAPKSNGLIFNFTVVIHQLTWERKLSGLDVFIESYWNMHSTVVPIIVRNAIEKFSQLSYTKLASVSGKMRSSILSKRVRPKKYWNLVVYITLDDDASIIIQWSCIGGFMYNLPPEFAWYNLWRT